jgi:hypothetical protein
MNKIIKAMWILVNRLNNQGLYVTWLWFKGRIIPGITGIPDLTYCKVQPNLLVGSQFSQKGKVILEQYGVSAVVNLRKEYDDITKGVWAKKYCYLPTVDDTAPAMDHLWQGIRFIDEEIKNGGRVYIHCGAGIGRAPTMAAAYLMHQGTTLDDALKKIKKVRPFINILPEQIKQLHDLEDHLIRKRTTC